MLRTPLRFVLTCFGLLLVTASDCDTQSTFPSTLFPGPPPAGGDPHISGRLVIEDGDGNSLNNAPVPDATVILGRESLFGTAEEIARTQSQADGSFVFESCNYGVSYRLWVELGSGFSASQGGVSCGNSVTLTLE